MQTTPVVAMYPNRFFSQVTPFAVHVKLGHQNTGVWVTDLDTGTPVEGARVRVYRARPAEALVEPEPLSEATTGTDGLAFVAGQAEINPKLETRKWEQVYDRQAEPIFFVRVDKGDDLALVPLASDFWIYPEAVNGNWIPNQSETRYGHVRAWGTTAQGVYRLGDTVQYKIYVRDQDNERFVEAPRGKYRLQVFDPMDKIVHDVDNVELNAFGGLDGELPLVETGAVGWYRFHLTADFTEGAWQPLQVLVADFTPAPFRVTTDLEGERFEPGDELRVVTRASLHAGGPYGDAGARITVNVTPTSVRSDNPKAQGFWFGGSQGTTTTLHQVETEVDAQGELESSFPILDQGFARGRLTVESAVRDDRGKYVASTATAAYLGANRFVGLRTEGWLLQAGEPSELEAIVVDESDEIAAGAELTLRVRYLETTASRVKGAGNAYITQYNHVWKDVTSCDLVSEAEPVVCRFTPDQPGRYALSAKVVDAEGRGYEVSMDRWAQGKGRVLWEESPGFGLEIQPEKAEYRVGDRARFLVKNPFPGARALVSVERYGVQRHWVQVLEDSSAVIELDVSEDHVPGFYFSVIVTSPRVEAPLGEGEVDLGKPAFRMGYVQVPVRDPVKEILVDVTTDRDLYQPRETVKVELTARPRQWASTEPPPIELAVAVLDESVFDLIGQGEAYFDPYRGFYELEPLDVENYNLLARLVGIQSFEKKGASAGGDGGMGPDLRTLFKYVSYWNPSIATDANGRASFELEVPDNLTGWRILAMAVTDADRMGLGQGHFVVNRPTELRTALPNQVTEGDTFDARFTLMNRTEEVRILTVSAAVSGSAESEGLAADDRGRRALQALPGELSRESDVRRRDPLHRARGRSRRRRRARSAPAGGKARRRRGRRHLRHDHGAGSDGGLPLPRGHAHRRRPGERRRRSVGPRQSRGCLRLPAPLPLRLLGAEAHQSRHGVPLPRAPRLRLRRLHLGGPREPPRSDARARRELPGPERRHGLLDPRRPLREPLPERLYRARVPVDARAGRARARGRRGEASKLPEGLPPAGRLPRLLQPGHGLVGARRRPRRARSGGCARGERARALPLPRRRDGPLRQGPLSHRRFDPRRRDASGPGRDPRPLEPERRQARLRRERRRRLGARAVQPRADPVRRPQRLDPRPRGERRAATSPSR